METTEFNALNFAFKEIAIERARLRIADMDDFFTRLARDKAEADVLQWHAIMNETLEELTSVTVNGNSDNSRCCRGLDYNFRWNPDSNSHAFRALVVRLRDDPTPMFKRMLFSYHQSCVHAADELNDDR